MYYPISCRKLGIQLCLFLSLFASFYVAHTQTLEEDNDDHPQQYKQPEAWSLYPCMIQIAPRIGGTSFVPLLNLAENQRTYNILWVKGISFDIGLLYVNRSIWQHFNAYPRLGLMISYDRTDNKGQILRGLLYLEPHYHHATRWQFLPRLGIGTAHVKIPGTYNKSSSKHPPVVDAFRQGSGLALLCGFLFKYRVTSQWMLQGGINVVSLPYKKEGEVDDRNLTIYSAPLGVIYTINPSYHKYLSQERTRRGQVNISWLNGWRKPNIDNDNQYYYVTGLRGQWSCQLVNNHALTVATEWVKDRAAKQELKNVYRDADLKISFLVGHEFLYGRVAFGQQLGIYALNDLIGLDHWTIYTKLGLSYKFTNGLLIGTSLKATPSIKNKPKPFATELIDLSIGYSF